MAPPALSGSKVMVSVALSLVGAGLALWWLVAGPPLFYGEAHALFDTYTARASTHPVVIDTLGGPVKRGLFRNYEISGTGLSGTASFWSSLSGPKGDAELHVTMSKSGGIWAHAHTQVSVAGQRAPLLSLSGEDGATTTMHLNGFTVVIAPGAGATWTWTEGTENWVRAADGTLVMADRANPTRTLTVIGEQFHRGQGLGEEEARERVQRVRARLAELQALVQSAP
ncbi:hypothetical protein P2318_24765 [Myxococcaceae bacterium GXIMD 01537]